MPEPLGVEDHADDPVRPLNLLDYVVAQVQTGIADSPDRVVRRDERPVGVARGDVKDVLLGIRARMSNVDQHAALEAARNDGRAEVGQSEAGLILQFPVEVQISGRRESVLARRDTAIEQMGRDNGRDAEIGKMRISAAGPGRRPRDFPVPAPTIRQVNPHREGLPPLRDPTHFPGARLSGNHVPLRLTARCRDNAPWLDPLPAPREESRNPRQAERRLCAGDLIRAVHGAAHNVGPVRPMIESGASARLLRRPVPFGDNQAEPKNLAR